MKTTKKRQSLTTPALHFRFTIDYSFFFAGYFLKYFFPSMILKTPLFYPLYTENATDFGDVLQHRGRLPFPVSITPYLFVF